MSRILVIVNEQELYQELNGILDSLGHEVFSPDAETAPFDYFLNVRPDLILLDEAACDGGGVELCRRIKDDESGFAVPVIMLQDDIADEVLEGANAGADHYIVKPFREQHLIANLKTSLKSAALHRDDFKYVKEHKVFEDRYKVQKLIGYGSHSTVFLTTDLSENNRLVAFKLIRREYTNDQIENNFLRIAAQIQELDSPDLIRIYGFGETEGRIFVAMEYAERGDILPAMRRKNFAELKALNLGLDILSSIKLLKEHKIYHLDIKPQNILRVGSRYKLGDFGVAVYREKDVKPEITDIWNAAPYVSPEHLHAPDKISNCSDIYSLGVTLYQAVTGDNPFDGGNPAITASRHRNLAPPFPHDVNPGISRYFSEAIMAMLIKDPDYRPSVDDLIKYFTQLQEYQQLFYEKTKEESTKHKPDPTETIDLTVEEAASLRDAIESSARAREAMDNLKPLVDLDKWRLFSVDGKSASEFFSKRTIVLFILGTALLMAVTITIGLYARKIAAAATVPENIRKGPLTVLKCRKAKCGFLFEKRTKAVGLEKCPKCGGAVGYAMECQDCKTIFPQREVTQGSEIAKKGILKINQYKYRCPKCESMNTRAKMTSVEQAATELRKRAARSFTPKTNN